MAGFFANKELGLITKFAIKIFIIKYDVDMGEALESNVRNYKKFNDFFTRALKNGARHIDDAPFVSPVDGCISQVGLINNGQILQAKKHFFSVAAILGGDDKFSALFKDGSFANIYLSPRDYHRVHMPCDGRLIGMRYIPGNLYSVNPLTARNIPGLFSRNERVVCFFEADFGVFSIILVGATIVGSIATVWHGLVSSPTHTDLFEWKYEKNEVILTKGEELGRFVLGSTVVMFFPAGIVDISENWEATTSVRQGSKLGVRIYSKESLNSNVN